MTWVLGSFWVIHTRTVLCVLTLLVGLFSLASCASLPLEELAEVENSIFTEDNAIAPRGLFDVIAPPEKKEEPTLEEVVREQVEKLKNILNNAMAQLSEKYNGYINEARHMTRAKAEQLIELNSRLTERINHLAQVLVKKSQRAVESAGQKTQVLLESLRDTLNNMAAAPL